MEQGATVLMFKAAEALRSQAPSKWDMAADIIRVSFAITGAVIFGALIMFVVLCVGVSVTAAAFQFVSSSLTHR